MQPQIHNIGAYDLYGKGHLTGCGLRGHSLLLTYNRFTRHTFNSRETQNVPIHIHDFYVS